MAVTTSKVELLWPVSVMYMSLIRLMLSREISTTEVVKLKTVKDGGGPACSTFSEGMCPRDQSGFTVGLGKPRASSPTAFRNCAKPRSSQTKWLKQIAIVYPPQVNSVT
ncbi:hypothetical protein LUZ61_018314 [Rhynchospora tenuis]|uniref:Uncharacterized protein n=1 Tax=Rhynchospora tenuis TaxID=198213 RepID=A0AAD5Z969_9POAL|nr:hypothetical protein LUZ61_018314 [Rhynchospora tenuis]